MLHARLLRKSSSGERLGLNQIVCVHKAEGITYKLGVVTMTSVTRTGQLYIGVRYLPGQPKRILRALLARYVPPQIWDLPKHGFDFPLQQFLAADDHALVRRYLEAGGWLDRGLLRADLVRSYARQFIAGDRRLAFRVWALAVLGAWLENHEQLR